MRAILEKCIHPRKLNTSMAAAVLKNKIQELMNERDEALEKGDALEDQLNDMKEQLLKVATSHRTPIYRAKPPSIPVNRGPTELERRLKLTEVELDHQSSLRNQLKKKSINLKFSLNPAGYLSSRPILVFLLETLSGFILSLIQKSKNVSPAQVEDERIKDDMKSQVKSINEMEELLQLIDTRYEELELDYNETMEDLNAL
eukprot:sb/3470648/